MTRAFASVQNKGVAITPYAIRKVVTADGRVLYQHDQVEQRVLVAPWVAAEMTDLLQSAVLSGTGRAAQIGRPVAGKTGTTTRTRTDGSSAFRAGSPPAYGWAATMPSRRGPAGRHRAGPRFPRFHDGCRRQPARRAIRHAGANSRLAADARRRDVLATRLSTPMRSPAGRREWNADRGPGGSGLSTTAADGPPDGTGDPSQQELDQAFPPHNRSSSNGHRRRNNSRLTASLSTPPPDQSEPRPITA